MILELEVYIIFLIDSNILELIENIDYNKLEIKELKEIQDRMLTSIGKSTVSLQIRIE